MLCSLVHLISRILDYSENTTSQRDSLCMRSKPEIINIVVMNFKSINFKLASFVFSSVVDLFQYKYNQF